MKLPIMTLKEYHALPQPSPSILSQAFFGVPHLNCYLNEKPEATDEQNLGSFIHDFIENKGSIDSIWKREFEKYQRKYGEFEAGDYKLDKKGNPIYSWVNIIEPERSLTVAKSARADAIIAALNKSSIIETLFSHELEIEPSYEVEINGVKVRTRPDIYDKTELCLWEIKTTTKPNAKEFGNQFFDLNYDMQSYIELKAGMESAGALYIKVLSISTDTPISIDCFEIDDMAENFQIGEHKAKIATENWKLQQEGNKKDFYEAEWIDVPLSYRALDYKMKNVGA